MTNITAKTLRLIDTTEPVISWLELQGFIPCTLERFRLINHPDITGGITVKLDQAVFNHDGEIVRINAQSDYHDEYGDWVITYDIEGKATVNVIQRYNTRTVNYHDAEGQMLRQTVVDSHGTETETLVNTFDTKGRIETTRMTVITSALSPIDETDPGAEAKVTFTASKDSKLDTFTYDLEGRITQATDSYGVCQFDYKGECPFPSRQFYPGPDGDSTGHEVLSGYDDKNNIISTEAGGQVIIIENTYDTEGRLAVTTIQDQIMANYEEFWAWKPQLH